MTIYPNDSTIPAVDGKTRNLQKGKSRGQHGQNFENQLKVQSGERAVKDSKASRFNERGFFRSVAVAADGSQTDVAFRPASSLPDSVRTPHLTKAETAIRIADISGAFKTLDIDSLKDFLGKILDGSLPAGEDQKVHRVQSKNPAAKVEMAESRPMICAKAPASIFQSSNAAASVPAIAPQKIVNSSDASKSNQASNILAQKAAVAERILKDQQLLARTPVKLAVTELENGIRLVAELRHLDARKRESLKNELLSLLALHGLGNYELQIEGARFFNRIIGNEDLP